MAAVCSPEAPYRWIPASGTSDGARDPQPADRSSRCCPREPDFFRNFGATYSVPPATGRLRGDSLPLDFPYPDGAFHDTFMYDPETETWTIHLRPAFRPFLMPEAK